MKCNIFLAAAFMAAAVYTPTLNAQSGFDDARIQTVLQQQATTVVRVKAAVDEIPAGEYGEKTEQASAEPKTPKVILRLGTGFFVGGEGLIVTNATVVHRAKRVWYELDNIPYLAEVKGIDVVSNVALLQAKTTPKNFTSVNLGDTVALPPLGSFLLRISLPMDFGSTPTLGLVQGADSQFGGREFPTRYIRAQFDTGPGEAGSPVFDLQGRFVGMTTFGLPELGATYVLPSRAISWVRDGILAGNGVMTYSFFGFNADENRSTAEGIRIIVKDVQSKGPAEASGLKAGDVIVEVSRKPARNLSDLRDAAFYTKPGQYLDLKVRRGSNEVALAIQAQGKPSEAETAK